MPKYEEVNWDSAECANFYTDMFYAVEEERSTQAYQYINAVRTICARCPIWFSCLAYAFQNESYGVWGGLTSHERRAIFQPHKYPAQRRRAFLDLSKYGITAQRIMEAYEHSLDVRGLAYQPAHHRKNGLARSSRPRE